MKHYVEIEGRRIDPRALAIHSTLIFLNAFLLFFLGSGAARIIQRAPGDPGADLLGSLITASLAALLKVVIYVGARTGAPLDAGVPPETRP